MDYHVAIVEDDETAQTTLISYFQRFESEHKVHIKTSTFTDGDGILFEYTADYDIIFLDIEMRRLDGMETAKKIREIDTEVILIFITNMSQYAVQGYQFDAMSFLLKPVPYFAFSKEMERAIARLHEKEQNHVLVPVESGMVKLTTKDIFYVESDKHTLTFHTNEGTFTLRATMKSMEKQLKPFDFYRINSYYLVNLAKVRSIEKEYAVLNGSRLKISRSRKKGFMEALTAYVGGRIK